MQVHRDLAPKRGELCRLTLNELPKCQVLPSFPDLPPAGPTGCPLPSSCLDEDMVAQLGQIPTGSPALPTSLGRCPTSHPLGALGLPLHASSSPRGSALGPSGCLVQPLVPALLPASWLVARCPIPGEAGRRGRARMVGRSGLAARSQASSCRCPPALSLGLFL